MATSSNIVISLSYLPHNYTGKLRESYIIDDELCDLRAKVLVACLVTPALWLNLSDSRNILIIHFGLLLEEHTLDSIEHDLWEKI